jgi:hypothetical protein
MISVKFINRTENISIDDLMKSEVFTELFKFNEQKDFENEEINEIDLSNQEFMTYENFRIALALNSDKLDENISKTMDFLNLDKKYISRKEYEELCARALNSYTHDEWELYLKWTAIDNKTLSSIISDMPLEFIKRYITKDNVNSIFVYKQNINFPLVCYVKNLDVLEYFIECGLDTSLKIDEYSHDEQYSILDVIELPFIHKLLI